MYAQRPFKVNKTSLARVPPIMIVGDDQIACRIDDGDPGVRLMDEEESSAIRGDCALLRVGAHVDRGGGCERDRIDNRHGSILFG